MSTLAFNNFKHWADILYKEDGIKYSDKDISVIDQMANGYCMALDTDNDRDKNKYIAGLMLRFWYNIGKLKMKSANTSLEFEDYMAWLYEAIEYACKYRAWQDPSKPNVKNAQQAINQCIETIRLQHHYEYNLDKHKANYNTVSMDFDLNGDSDSDRANTVQDTLPDEDELFKSRQSESDDSVRSMIQRYINKKKLIEAIILDTIAFNDVEKVTKETVKDKDFEGNDRKYTKAYREFWPFRCVQILSTLPEDYATYFGTAYSINPVEFDKALAAVRAANNQKLYRYVRSCLEEAKTVFSY